jgi:copper chaperone
MKELPLSVITLSIPDLSCGHCVASVKEALQDLPGLVSCEVDLAAKRASLNLADAAQLPEALRRLDEEGYPATPVA